MEFQAMSPDDMQRTMQFLLHQQAQFAANVAKNEVRWTERFDRLSTKTDRIADGLIGLTGIVGQLAAAQMRTDEQLRQTDEQLRQTDDQLRQTDAHLRDVEAHLDIVIQMFERHLRDDHGPPAS